MGFTVLEQFVEGKSAGRLCEDLIVVTDDFAAVIDGASDATGAQFDGKSGGRFAAEVVADTIATLPVNVDARAFADALASALAAAVTTAAGVLGPDVRWPVAVLTCASAHRRQVWRVGDGNVVIAGIAHYGARRIDDAVHSFRAAANAALYNKGTPLEELIASDPGALAARLLIDNQQHLANRIGPWGYGCINGQAVPDDYIEQLPIPNGPTEVILASDGYPVVLSTRNETEEALREMVQHDPGAIGEHWSIGKSLKPGANAPDDRAYLRLAFD